MNQVLCGKCEDVLKGIPANSVDSIVTDPPYGIKFMGKKWDCNVNVDIANERIRLATRQTRIGEA